MTILRHTLGRTWTLWAFAGVESAGAVFLADWLLAAVAALVGLAAAGVSGWIAGRAHQERAATARVRQIVLDLERRLLIEQGALLDCRDGDELRTGG